MRSFDGEQRVTSERPDKPAPWDEGAVALGTSGEEAALLDLDVKSLQHFQQLVPLVGCAHPVRLICVPGAAQRYGHLLSRTCKTDSPDVLPFQHLLCLVFYWLSIYPAWVRDHVVSLSGVMPNRDM